MPKVLNSAEAYEVCMGGAREATILEGVVVRLAGELGILMKEADNSGISYKKALEGRKGSIELDYHRDFDDYECFAAQNGAAQIHVSVVDGIYGLCLKNSGEKLLVGARQKRQNDLEKKIATSLILSLVLARQPQEVHEPIFDITEAELELITAGTLLKYLS